MKYFVLIVLSVFFFFPCYAKIDVKFTPSKDCEEAIVSFINNAENSIDVVVYAINNDKIVSALKKAYDRGVALRILTDRLQASGKYSRVLELYKYGINVRVNTKHKIEHNKFAVFDSNVASTGSFNWTNSATLRNSENCLFLIQDKDNIAKYQNRFEYLWKINTKRDSEKWFMKKYKKLNNHKI